MSDAENIVCKIVIPLQPITKKNHQQIIMAHGRHIVIQANRYLQYEKDAGYFIHCKNANIDYPINLKMVYYMSTKRKVDLGNLQNATCDILVKYKVLADDNCKIVASMDGSRVYYDKEHPRTEITITKLKTTEEN